MAEIGLPGPARPRGVTYSLTREQEPSPSDVDFMPPEVGVDKLGCCFPVGPRDDRLPWERTGLPWQVKCTAYTANGAKVHLRHSSLPYGDRGFAEFNPSRVWEPHGHGLCPSSQLLPVAREVFEIIKEYLRPHAVRVGHLPVSRLDLTYDFHRVREPMLYVRGLERAARTRVQHVELLPVEADRPSLYIKAGKGSGHVIVYDRHNAHWEIPAGTMRWEACCLKGWLSRAEIKRLDDAQPDVLDDLASALWDWSACGVAVVHPEQVVTLVQEMGLTPTLRRNFIGYVQERASDHAEDLAAAGTEMKLKRLQKRAKFVVAPTGLVPSDNVSWLDRSSKTEQSWTSRPEVAAA